MADEQNRDQYKFPMQLRYAMERAATVLMNCADFRHREMDEDSQVLMRNVLDELDNACAEANLAARRAAPIAAQLDQDGCGRCPRDTPYGPATCGKCLEAEERLSAAQLDQDAERIKQLWHEAGCAVSVGTAEMKFKFAELLLQEAARRAAPVAAQLDQDAERAAFEAWYQTLASIPDERSTGKWLDPSDNEIKTLQWPKEYFALVEKVIDGGEIVLEYEMDFMRRSWAVWQASAARRTAPVAAQLDAELPLLPYTKWSGFDPATGKDFGYYRTEEVEQIRRNAIAPYAERIRLLEREHGLLSMVIEQLKARLVSADALIADMATKADRSAYIDGRTAGTASKAPDPTEAAIEQRAKEIYAAFEFSDRYPWVEGGNSIRQDDARYQARAEFAAAPSPQENTK